LVTGFTGLLQLITASNYNDAIYTLNISLQNTPSVSVIVFTSLSSVTVRNNGESAALVLTSLPADDSLATNSQLSESESELIYNCGLPLISSSWRQAP
jgi:hypothetical protein